MVVIVPAELMEELAGGVMLVGKKVQVEAWGAPEQPNETAAAKLLIEVAVTEKLAVPPAVRVSRAGVSVREKSG